MTAQRRQTVAVGILFYVNGAVFSNWLPRVDEVRDRLGVGNGGLGIALLGGGLGGLLGALAIRRILQRMSTLRALRFGATGLAIAFPFVAVVPTVWSLLLVLTITGFLDVVNDSSMNAEAADIQARLANSIMQRVHAMWSLGFVTGGLLGWGASAIDLGLGVHLTIVSCVLVVTITVVLRVLGEGHGAPVVPHESHAERVPRIGVVFIALIAVAVAFIEVTPNEWSAIALRDLFDAGAVKGAGPVTFAACMLLGRLLGDRLVDRVGGRTTMWWAIWVCFAGMGLTIAAPRVVVALVGFGLWGLGVSVLFPQVYLLAANAKENEPGAGLAVLMLAQRGSFLATSVVVGSIAEVSNIRVSFATVLVGAGLLYVISLSRWKRGSVSRTG